MNNSAPRRLAVRAAAVKSSTKTPEIPMKALNITKANLINSQDGAAVRNVDGVIYSISYDAATDAVKVLDRSNQLEYDVSVGAKDNRISIILDSATPSATPVNGAPTFQELQMILKGDGPGPEAINGRVAMAAFFGIAVVEKISGLTVIEQAATPVGATAAISLVLLTLVASIAPALTGKVPVSKVLPSTDDSFPDRPLPFLWTPLAEKINSRVAMLGLVALIGNELVRGVPVF